MSSTTLTALDRRLFDATGWFLIDRDQRKVADADSLSDALALVEQGHGAAVVGQLARGVAAVDIDAGGIEGDAIAEHLIGWLTARGRWHLLRPSGGGPGRLHVICVPGTDTVALAAYVNDLRATYGLPKVLVDHRGAGGGSQTLRPLSSPHRHTGEVPRPLGTEVELHAALAALPRPRTAAPKVSARTHRADRATRAAGTVALVPLARTRRDIDLRWSAWLEGRGPAPVMLGRDQSRSAIELAATSALVRAGIDVDEAWHHVLTARGGAFARSRERGRPWWTRHHWNTAVQSDTTWRTTNHHSAPDNSQTTQESSERRSAASASNDTQLAVEAARSALRALQWRFGHRERHSFLLVAHTLLDRMLRDDELAVPCPVRFLELKTGLSRRTVIAALRALDGPLGRRTEAFDHTRADSSSHIFELDTRYSPTGLSLHAPPSFTPTPRHAGCWASLPPLAHTLWRALPAEHAPAIELKDLGPAVGLSHGASQPPTPRQLRTLRGGLEELENAGLARRSSEGHWHRSIAITPAHQRRSAATHRLILDRITRERTEYRAGAWSRWQRDRLAALRRNRARQRDWWSSLTIAERDHRRQERIASHGALPQTLQAEERHRIATARHRAGEPSERSLHAAWSRQFTRLEQADTSAAWQAKFEALSPHEKQTRAQQLDEHRRRWRLPLTWSTAAPTRADQPPRTMAA